jgi:hypothetical protein
MLPASRCAGSCEAVGTSQGSRLRGGLPDDYVHQRPAWNVEGDRAFGTPQPAQICFKCFKVADHIFRPLLVTVSGLCVVAGRMARERNKKTEMIVIIQSYLVQSWECSTVTWRFSVGTGRTWAVIVNAENAEHKLPPHSSNIGAHLALDMACCTNGCDGHDDIHR